MGNRTSFMERSLLYPQHVGTEFIKDFRYAVHTVRKQLIDTLNLLTVLKLDAKAFQIISFGSQSKSKIHRTNGR